jgi:raffinose/stachyose/melibiose transport system permease protein
MSTRPRRADFAVRYFFLILLSVLTIGPLVAVALAAFNPPGSPVSGVSLPQAFTLESFGYAWQAGGFASAFSTGGLVTVLVVVIVTAGSISAGYAFGTMKFRGSRVLYYVFLTGIVTPYVVLVVPMYLEFQTVGLLGTVWGLVLPEAGLYLAFGVFWMNAFFASVPRPLIEAARIDGASSFRILVQILLPIAMPAVTTLIMLTFLTSWNEYLVPLVMGGGGSIQTVSLGLASFQGQHVTDIPALAAASFIVAGPAIVIYVLTQRSFFKGLLQGAVK